MTHIWLLNTAHPNDDLDPNAAEFVARCHIDSGTTVGVSVTVMVAVAVAVMVFVGWFVGVLDGGNAVRVAVGVAAGSVGCRRLLQLMTVKTNNTTMINISDVFFILRYLSFC
jgi:hypothetical protein